jgi:hypothetical protein
LTGRSARNIIDGPQTGRRHLEDTELARGAEPVFHGAHHALRVMALAFEIQHGVHDVLEGLGPGEAAVFRDVADEERRNVLALRGEQQLRGGFAHLSDAAGRRLELQRKHRLHGVDDDERRFDARDLLQDPLEARLGKQIQRRGADGEPLAARFDLMLRFLAGAIQHRTHGARHVGRRLQQQRGLADARLSTEQHERPRDDAAAKHAIEFADPCRQPRVMLERNVGIELCRAGRAGERIPVARRWRAAALGRTLLDQGIPRTAVGAAAKPLGRLGAALLTHKNGLDRLGHAILELGN